MCVTPLFEYQLCRHSAGAGETDECEKARNWEICVQTSTIHYIPGRCDECKRALRQAASEYYTRNNDWYNTRGPGRNGERRRTGW